MWTVRHPTAAAAPRRRTPDNVWWGLLGLGVLLTIIVRAAWLSAPEPDDAEVSLVGQVLALAGMEPASFGVSPAALQISWWTSTGAWDRAASVLGAAREAMLVTSALTAVLVWLLARRLGVGPAWATAALMLLAICPPLLDVQRTVVAANVALPWMLGALILATSAAATSPTDPWVGTLTEPAADTDPAAAAGPTSAAIRWEPARDAGVLACTVLAVATAPIMLALVPSVLWLHAQARRTRHALFLGVAVLVSVAAALVLAPLAGFGIAVRDAGLGNLLDPERVTADPVTPLLVAAVTLLGLGSRAVRPVAAGLVLVPAVAVLTGEPWAAVVATAVPLGFLLLAGLVGGVVDTAARPVRHLRRTGRAHLYAPVGTAVLVVGALAAWSPVIARLPATLDAAAFEAARAWMARNGSTSELVLSDSRTQLAVVNARDWTHTRAGPGAGEVVATFGQGTNAVNVHSLPYDDTTAERDIAARRVAGEQVALSQQLLTDEPLRELLRQGRVSAPAALTLATLVAAEPVRLVDLPVVAAEDAIGLPRRHLLLRPPDGNTERIVDFYMLQRGAFRPAGVVLTPDGVLVTYPPTPPYDRTVPTPPR